MLKQHSKSSKNIICGSCFLLLFRKHQGDKKSEWVRYETCGEMVNGKNLKWIVSRKIKEIMKYCKHLQVLSTTRQQRSSLNLHVSCNKFQFQPSATTTINIEKRSNEREWMHRERIFIIFIIEGVAHKIHIKLHAHWTLNPLLHYLDRKNLV